MNCFQLIKTVLDEAYAAIPGKAAAKDAAIQAELNQLSKDYKNLLQTGCLDYSDPCRRFAYIYRYTTSHANLIFSKINTHPTLQKLFDNDKLVVSCIGGGPGSDFLGIMKYCINAKKSWTSSARSWTATLRGANPGPTWTTRSNRPFGFPPATSPSMLPTRPAGRSSASISARTSLR